MPKLTQEIVDTWLEAAWRNGLALDADGDHAVPDFAPFDPRVTDPNSAKSTPEELSKLQFNTCCCPARMFKGHGHPVQCSRKTAGAFCKTHQKSADNAQKNGLNIRFGRFDEERPTHWLDKALDDDSREKISWFDTKKQTQKKVGSKNVKVKDMKEYLTERLPNESLKGLKKPALEELYYKEKEAEKSESETESDEETVSPEVVQTLDDVITQVEVPVETPVEVPVETPVEEAVMVAKAARLARLTSNPEVTPEVVPEVVPEVASEIQLVPGIETMEPEPEPEPDAETDSAPISTPLLSEESEEEMVDEQVVKTPSTVAEYREFLKAAGVMTDGVKGARAFKQLYVNHMELCATQECDDDDDDDDELEEDTREFVEIDYDGVEYLEDEASGEIFSINHTLIGKWDAEPENIIWVNDSVRNNHETNRD